MSPINNVYYLWKGASLMDTTDWKMLLALSREKTMAKAGDSIFISQPAVAYRMNRLEDEFQVQLFVRTPKGVFFTPAGETLLAHAEDMLERNDNIYDEVMQKGSGLRGSITIGSSATFLMSYLPGQLKEFTSQYSDISISLLNKGNDVLFDMLSHDQLMVSIIRGTPPWHGNHYHLFDDPLVVINSEPFKMEDLQERPYIPYSSESALTDMIKAWTVSNFKEPLKVIVDATRTTGTRICLNLVRAGLGWSVVPLTRIGLTRNAFYIEPVTDAKGKPIARATELMYTDYAKAHKLYSTYIDHFISYFSDFDFLNIH